MRHAAVNTIRKAYARLSGISPPPPSPAPPRLSFEISLPCGRALLDGIHVDLCGLIRIEGRCEGVREGETLPTVSLDGIEIPFLQHFRFNRMEILPGAEQPSTHSAVALEYLVPETLIRTFHVLEIGVNGRRQRFESSFAFVNPHYRGLLHSSAVLHRADIYGSGPPNSAPNPEIVEIAKELPPPLLDFGCGKGALVKRLRELGREAYGLELYSSNLQTAILPEVHDRITFYDGSFPTRFEDGQFHSTVCSEVLEHIPNFGEALAEIARITRHSALFTVPDASAIPAGFRHSVVPWHLLEATHVNFFNQTSLTHELRRYFRKVEIGRSGCTYVNDSRAFASLTALCSK
ncbi:MAG TPA: class I SAM-dependent methyltransferase [Bryobacteraceae bacterium]